MAESTRPFVFLSSGVPRARQDVDWERERELPVALASGGDRTEFLATLRTDHARFVEGLDETQIEAAIAAIVRGVARRGWGLASFDDPPVLAMIHASVAALDEELERPVIELHRCAQLMGDEPSEAARELVRGGATIIDARAETKTEEPPLSWTTLREAIVCRQLLYAGFFVGGARSCFENAALLRLHRPRVPMFAFGATSGASRVLLGGAPLAPRLMDSVAWTELVEPDSPSHDLVTHGSASAFAGELSARVDEFRGSLDFDALVDEALALAERRMATPDPDFEALQRWLGGDERAGSKLFVKYYDLVDRYCRKKMRASDRKDVVQDVFVRLTRTASSFRGDCTFRSHVYRVARRTLVDYYRSLKPDFDPLTHSVADVVGVGQETALSTINRHRALLRCVEELPVEERNILELYYWEGVRSNELAPSFGVQPETIRWRISKIRSKLRDCYNRRCPDGGELVGEGDVIDRLKELEHFMSSGPASDDGALQDE